MKKRFNKGFVLTETLIVSTMLVTVLVLMYSQFKNVTKSYDQSFQYNKVDSLYALYNVKKYIQKENYVTLAARLQTNEYVDIKTCSGIYFSSTMYCRELMSSLKIEELYLTNENLTLLKKKNDFNYEMNKFLKTIKHGSSTGYRLIARFEDDTYASLKIFNGDEYLDAIAGTCSDKVSAEYTIKHINDANNAEAYTTDNLKGTCGQIIDVLSKAKDTNACLYASLTSVPSLALSNNKDLNIATINYKTYESTITINHYTSGTTTTLAPATVLTLPCGSTLNPNDYIKSISGKQFVNASENTVLINKENRSVNLYYTTAQGD